MCAGDHGGDRARLGVGEARAQLALEVAERDAAIDRTARGKGNQQPFGTRRIGGGDIGARVDLREPRLEPGDTRLGNGDILDTHAGCGQRRGKRCRAHWRDDRGRSVQRRGRRHDRRRNQTPRGFPPGEGPDREHQRQHKGDECDQQRGPQRARLRRRGF